MRFLADENFDGRIIDGVRHRAKLADIARAIDVGLFSAKDPAVLAWAAEEARVLLTHDVKTIPGYAYARVGNGLRMPGVIAVPRNLGLGKAALEIATIFVCCADDDLDNQVWFLPL